MSEPEQHEPLSFDAAVAAVTAAGSPFEIVEVDVAGRMQRVFAGTPPSLRALFDTGRSRADQVYLVYEDERWTFGEVMGAADALGAGLVDRLGVRPGDRVAIAMRNYPEWVTSLIAVTSIGAVAVPLNAWWTTEELAYGLHDSGSRVVIADHERVDRLLPLLGQVDLQVVSVRDVRPPTAGVLPLSEVAVRDAAMPVVEIDPDDDATILYTSGTTGHPKGAVSTHRAVLSALMAFACRAAVNATRSGPRTERHPFPTSYILVVPLFHVTGCVPVLLGSFAGGNKLVIMHKWNPERALELIERERVTTFVGVPTMSWDLLESPDFGRRDTSSLVAVGGGGAPAPPELVRRIDRSFQRGRPNIGYGMTETNAYGPQNVGDDYVERPTSAGRTVPVMQVRVVDVDTREALPVGQVGEIEFAGPNLIRGYWNRPDATAETFDDGWLRTGDLGRLDADGYVYVEDRVKDMVLRGGENIYCAEVEAVLYEHPAVYEATAFGIPHERLGEELVAAIVVRDGHQVTVEDLQAHVGRHLAPFKVPARIEFVGGQLPRGATGKILKRQLRDEMVARDDAS